MRLIDADALVHDLIDNRSFYPVCVRRAIEDAPTIDAKPVVHGRWEKVGDEKDWRCTACGTVFCFPVGDPIRLKDNYCSECGAVMRERKKHD